MRGDYATTIGPAITDTSDNPMSTAYTTTLELAQANVVFTSGMSISETNTTYDGQDILIDGTGVAIDGPHNFDSVQLVNNAVLTHDEVTPTQTHSLDLTVNQQVIVDPTSRIDVSGLGYAPGYTTGNTTVGGATGRSGGSYGGLGQDDRGTTNAAYGDYTNPDDFGSGGGPGGGAGGGLVRITAATLDLDGQVLADGGDAGYDDSGGYGGGSGGGIYVSVTTLSGAGRIAAASGDINGGGFAGGGRVAVYAADFSGFNVANITAPAGGHGGSAGTVYLKTTGDAQGTLIIDPGPTGYSPGFTPLGLQGQTNFSIPDAVVIRGINTRVIPATPGLALDFQGSLTITNSAQLLMPGISPSTRPPLYS